MGLFHSLFHTLRVGLPENTIRSFPLFRDQAIRKRRRESLCQSAVRPAAGLSDQIQPDISLPEGEAEIDCLILYRSMLFAVEVKRWRGTIIENDDGSFLQHRSDNSFLLTSKSLKSPFRQLNRAISLLKKQHPSRAWIEPIVCFEEADRIRIQSDGTWFDRMSDLISYLNNAPPRPWGPEAADLFERCRAADLLHCNDQDGDLICLICDEFLRFPTKNGILTRQDICSISIFHRWSYDILMVKTWEGACYSYHRENDFVPVIENGRLRQYALCQLDFILPGQEQ